jgi:RHS repeat-associated protein
VDGVGSVDGQDTPILDFIYDYDQVGNRQSEEYHHLDTPVWDKYYYDNLRRLNQVDYAQSSGFSLATESTESDLNQTKEYRLAYLASYVLRWLDDGITPAAEKENLAQRRKDAGKQNEYNITSVPSVADRVLTLAEFGDSSVLSESAQSVKSVVPRTETIYDDNGKLSAQIVYDANGNITLFALYPDDGSKVVIVSSYDTDGNLISQVFTTYDADGNVISREEMPLPTVTAEPAPTNIGVIPNPLVGEESVYSATSSFSQADLWLLEAELLYDGGMLLMSIPSGPSAASEEFAYDHLGNRYQHTDKDSYVTTYTNNPVNQYGLISKDYSFFGLKDERYPSYDENGNLSEDGQGYIYTYDYRNRLVKVEFDTDMIAEYTYDALGRRIAKTAGDTTTFFYYNTDNQVIAQYIQEQSEDVQPDRSFVYGNGITEVLAMFLYEKPYSQDDVDLLFGFFDCWLTSSGGNGYNESYDYVNDNKIDLNDWSILANHEWSLPDLPTYETRFYYLTDALGSVRGLIGGRLNREEDREFYNYDVYGAPSESSAVGNPILFAGHWYDAERGLYHTMYRPYDPGTGRWLQFEKYGVIPNDNTKYNEFNPSNQYHEGANLYQAMLSNPIKYKDMLGLSNIGLALQAIRGYIELEKQLIQRSAAEYSKTNKESWGKSNQCADQNYKLLQHIRNSAPKGFVYWEFDVRGRSKYGLIIPESEQFPGFGFPFNHSVVYVLPSDIARSYGYSAFTLDAYRNVPWSILCKCGFQKDIGVSTPNEFENAFPYEQGESHIPYIIDIIKSVGNDIFD